MAKYRKTLKEKKRADLRRKFIFKTDHLTKISTDYTPISVESAPVVSITNKYPYLMQDVLKTVILTCAIVTIQVILFFLLKKQILILPMVKY